MTESAAQKETTSHQMTEWEWDEMMEWEDKRTEAQRQEDRESSLQEIFNNPTPDWRF